MVRIAITQAAFDAMAKTLALGSVGYENATNEKGERMIWLEANVVDRLRAMRRPGTSSSAWRRRARRLTHPRRAVSPSRPKAPGSGERGPDCGFEQRER
jgi:hypothetical protein